MARFRWLDPTATAATGQMYAPVEMRWAAPPNRRVTARNPAHQPKPTANEGDATNHRDCRTRPRLAPVFGLLCCPGLDLLHALAGHLHEKGHRHNTSHQRGTTSDEGRHPGSLAYGPAVAQALCCTLGAAHTRKRQSTANTVSHGCLQQGVGRCSTTCSPTCTAHSLRSPRPSHELEPSDTGAAKAARRLHCHCSAPAQRGHLLDGGQAAPCQVSPAQ